VDDARLIEEGLAGRLEAGSAEFALPRHHSELALAFVR
jgi:hypothetical protein